MTAKRKTSGKATSIPKGLATGAAVELGITILGAMFLGRMVSTEWLPWENVGYGIMLTLFLASYLGCCVSCLRIKRQKLMVAVASGAVYFVALLMITALFFGGQYEAVGVTAAIILAGCGTCFLLGNTENRGGKKRNLRKRYR